MKKFVTAFLLLFVLTVVSASAQPGRTISTFPYTQDFSFVTQGVASFPTTDTDGGEFLPGDSTDTDWTSGTSAGIQNGGGKLRLQTTNTKTRQGIVWYGDFSGANADSVTIAWNKLTSGTQGTPPRVNELRIATNGGSGSSFTDISGVTWPQFDNSSTSQSGTLRVRLPSTLHNASDVRIQIYTVELGGTSVSGNHAKVEIDDLKITTRCLGPAQATIDSVGNAGTHTLWLYFNPGARTDSVLVVRRSGSAPTATPNDYMRYSVGQGLNSTDTVVFWGPVDAVGAFNSGLTSNTTYHFALFGYRSCAEAYSTAATASGTTLNTCSGFPDKVTALRVTNLKTTSVTVDFRAGARTDTLLILRRLNAPPNYTPVPGKRYSVGQTFGLNNIVAYFGPPVGPVELTGLLSDSTYMLAYYGFQSCNANYTQTGSVDTLRTVCTGNPLNVSALTIRARSSISIGLQISTVGFADHYMVLERGPDNTASRPVNGTVYNLGDVIGDDTVKYYGVGRKATIGGLAASTAYTFYAFGVRECNSSYSTTAGSVSTSTTAACGGPLSLANPQGLTVVRNVKDTLQLRWSSVAGADSFLVVARIDSTPLQIPEYGTLYDRNDAVGEGFALATVKDTTVTLVRLPANIAYFIRVYAFRKCDFGYSFASTTAALATPGTATQQRFVIRANTLPNINFGGAIIKFTKAPNADGSLMITRHSGPPGTNGLPLHRNNDQPVNVVSADRWWSFSKGGLDSFTYNMQLDITGLPGVKDTSDLEILYRPHTDSLWDDIVTSGYEVRDTLLYIYSNDRHFFSDYGIGGQSSRNVLPVNLLSFDAYWNRDRAVLRWRTGAELHNEGFRIDRASVAADGTTGTFVPVASYLTHPGLHGAGTSNSEHDYGFVDADAMLRRGGSFLYRLEEVSTDGVVHEVGRAVVDAQDAVEGTDMGLTLISPNPVTGSTVMLRYMLPETGAVSVVLYSADGRAVRVLLDERSAAAGMHSSIIDIADVPSGTYFCRMTTAEGHDTRTIIVTR